MSIFLSSLVIFTGLLPVFSGYVLFFILGGIVGSFLNVVIHRVPREESVVFPNSACPNCHQSIRPYDNIPIFSWLILRGKCRSCRNPISGRYPAVELLTALVFVVIFWQIGLTPFLPVALVFAAAIIALIFIDAEHMILPNVITYPLLILSLLIRLFFPVFFGSEYFTDIGRFPLNELSGQMPVWLVSVIGAVLGGLAGGGSLWLVGEIWKRLRGVDAMGLGDVKMMFAVGALIGWRLALFSIFAGAFFGAVIGLVVIARQKEKDFQTQIPFGIFLGIGSLTALLFGEQLLRWYFETFVP